jgi:hypothetical protein
MVPVKFVSFFAAMAEGRATLLGLLFVAMSIRSADGIGTQEVPEAAFLADGALLALGSGFVISAAALLPDINVAWVVLPMSALGACWATRIVVQLARAWRAQPEPGGWRERTLAVAPNVAAGIVAAALLERAAQGARRDLEKWCLRRSSTSSLRWPRAARRSWACSSSPSRSVAWATKGRPSRRPKRCWPTARSWRSPMASPSPRSRSCPV